jgi:hypothetical protein
MNEPVLCYITGSSAFFTTQDLEKQWGDDWNDAPYEHNAGDPYEWREMLSVDDTEPRYEIIEIHWSADLLTPDYNELNSRYSVEAINRREMPWLRSPSWSLTEPPLKIWAGTPLADFKAAIRSVGGRIWVEEFVLEDFTVD